LASSGKGVLDLYERGDGEELELEAGGVTEDTPEDDAR
jgi:hypothetical protein